MNPTGLNTLKIGLDGMIGTRSADAGVVVVTGAVMRWCVSAIVTVWLSNIREVDADRR